MPGEFCEWLKDGDRTECRRCGCVNYDGHEPTCPPWITRSEPNGKRLPHIKSLEQNKAIFQKWIDDENYKLAKVAILGTATEVSG
jgi:hypothetical protein